MAKRTVMPLAYLMQGYKHQLYPINGTKRRPYIESTDLILAGAESVIYKRSIPK